MRGIKSVDRRARKGRSGWTKICRIWGLVPRRTSLERIGKAARTYTNEQPGRDVGGAICAY